MRDYEQELKDLLQANEVAFSEVAIGLVDSPVGLMNRIEKQMSAQEALYTAAVKTSPETVAKLGMKIIEMILKEQQVYKAAMTAVLLERGMSDTEAESALESISNYYNKATGILTLKEAVKEMNKLPEEERGPCIAALDEKINELRKAVQEDKPNNGLSIVRDETED